jgi:hypothetical protein
MTITLFLSLFTIFPAISALITEGIKAMVGENHIHSNIISAIVSVVVAWGGTAVAYVFLKVPFNELTNILALVLMAVPVWLVAMVGYDKVLEVVKKSLEVKK